MFDVSTNQVRRYRTKLSNFCLQAFAMKVFNRAMIGANRRDEAEAMDAICMKGHENIVILLGHGPFPNDQYYIDMELCALTLHSYIVDDYKSAFGIDNYLDPVQSDSTLTCMSMWGILSHIASGLKFIHGLGYVHRDLKPKNGTK